MSRVQTLIRRLSAEPPMVVIVDGIPHGEFIQTVRDMPGEPRREAFVMAHTTWTLVEHGAALMSPRAVGRWFVGRASDVGDVSVDGKWLRIPIVMPMDPVTIGAEVPTAATVQVREWLVPIR